MLYHFYARDHKGVVDPYASSESVERPIGRFDHGPLLACVSEWSNISRNPGPWSA